jgi:hypothetical protein
MRVSVDGRVRRGRAVEVTGAPADAVVAAVRGERSEEADPTVRVDCPDPCRVHRHIGRLPPASFDRRAALVAVARTEGHTSPARDRLDDAREQLSALSAPPVDLSAARRRVAEAGDAEARLRERVAELRGRLDARRETGADTAAVEDELADVVARLSEAETERIAAEQALSRARSEARDARDRRDRRLELEDRIGNLERTVRADLAAAVWDRFRAAVAAVPGDASVGGTPGAYQGSETTAALAVARLAALDAPVVVDGLDCLGGADAAATLLDAPAIYIR